MFKDDPVTKDLFAEPRLVTSLDDCLFYHTTDIPGHGTVQGFWDIRGREAEYLGGAGFEGRRVLEIGPGSGHLSFHMERRGAEVVSVEAADVSVWDLFWDIHDALPEDLEEMLADSQRAQDRIKNSYWLCHRLFSSKAKVHYGTAYQLPRQLGEFDTSVVASVLLHNKYPLRILENCARVTRDTIVVVEPLRERQLSQSPAELLPQAPGRRWWDTWWGFSPKYFTDALRSLGFPHARVSFHTQQAEGRPYDLFTVVASRRPPDTPDAPDEPVAVRLGCHVERLRVEAGGLAHLGVRITNAGVPVLTSVSATPFALAYHWRRRDSGEVVVWDGLRTLLPRDLHRGDADDVVIAVRAPAEPGEYVLELSLVKEGVTWYDGRVEGLPLGVEAVVTP